MAPGADPCPHDYVRFEIMNTPCVDHRHSDPTRKHVHLTLRCMMCDRLFEFLNVPEATADCSKPGVSDTRTTIFLPIQPATFGAREIAGKLNWRTQ